MACDSDALFDRDVRRAVLSSIGVFKSTLPSILKRTRDVKEDVRKLAYTIVSEKLSVRQLAINQRVAVLQDGLQDRDEGVRAACQNLLGTVWYNALGADPLKVRDRGVCVCVQLTPLCRCSRPLTWSWPRPCARRRRRTSSASTQRSR